MERGLEEGEISLEIFRLVKGGEVERSEAGIAGNGPIGGGFEIAMDEPALGEVFLVLFLADGSRDEGGFEWFGLGDGMEGSSACFKLGHDSCGWSRGSGCGFHLAQLPMMRPGMSSQRMPLMRKREARRSPASLPYLAKRLRMRTEIIRRDDGLV
jgi:hypothetical protein